MELILTPRPRALAQDILKEPSVHGAFPGSLDPLLPSGRGKGLGKSHPHLQHSPSRDLTQREAVGGGRTSPPSLLI